MPPDPATAASIPPYLVAILISAVGVLAGVVAYLFKHYSSKQDESQKGRLSQEQDFARERITWATERQKIDTAQEAFEIKLRLEYETKHRALSDQYMQMMREIGESSREHEDAVRKEFAEIMETVASEATKGQEKIALVMDKFYNKYVSPPRSRPKG